MIYSDTKSLLEKMHAFTNNQEKSTATKVGKHTSCSYSISTI